jgi:mono/diheme cytochrome c family protein
MNRETAAAVMGLQSGILIVLAVMLFALLNDPGPRTAAPLPGVAASPEAPVNPVVERGWAVYQAERCSSCHSIAGEGSPRYPLDGVADRLGADELRLWVVDPQQMRPGVRKRGYDHLLEEDLAALVTFLEHLGTPP